MRRRWPKAGGEPVELQPSRCKISRYASTVFRAMASKKTPRVPLLCAPRKTIAQIAILQDGDESFRKCFDIADWPNESGFPFANQIRNAAIGSNRERRPHASPMATGAVSSIEVMSSTLALAYSARSVESGTRPRILTCGSSHKRRISLATS